MTFIGRRTIRLENREVSQDRLDIDNITDPTALTNNLLGNRIRNSKKKYNFLRMSEVEGACPREWVIGHMTKGYVEERIQFGNLVAMNMGSALHHWLQNYSDYFEGRLNGYWRCAACGADRRFGEKPMVICEYCGASPRATFYKEYMYHVRQPFRVVSKMDLILKVAGRFRIGEIKTTKETKLDRPLPRDLAQVSGYLNFYQYVSEENKLPIDLDTSVAYIFYFKKTFDWKSPVATFKVERESPYSQMVIEKARKFTDGLYGGPMPPALGACVSSSFISGKAKNCAMARICEACHKRGTEVFVPEEVKNVQ